MRWYARGMRGMRAYRGDRTIAVTPKRAGFIASRCSPRNRWDSKGTANPFPDRRTLFRPVHRGLMWTLHVCPRYDRLADGVSPIIYEGVAYTPMELLPAPAKKLLDGWDAAIVEREESR